MRTRCVTTSLFLFASGAMPAAANAAMITDCETECPADINGDSEVNGFDLALVLGSWLTDDPDADLNDDGTVNGGDITHLLGMWGSSCGDQPTDAPCTEPSIPAQIAIAGFGGVFQISDHYVGCTTNITYLHSQSRLDFVTGDPQYIQDNSFDALNAINNQADLAATLCGSFDSTGAISNCTYSSRTVPTFCNGVPGNALTFWTMGGSRQQEPGPFSDMIGLPVHEDWEPFPYFKLMQWSLAVDFQFGKENGWAEKLIKAAATLEAQLKTVPSCEPGLPLLGCDGCNDHNPDLNPPPVAPAQTLWRGATALDSEFEKLAPGATLYVRGFWATTDLGAEVARAFIPDDDEIDPLFHVHNILYFIDYKAGQYKGMELDKFSALSDEGEVLFPPYVQFTVTKMCQDTEHNCTNVYVTIE